MTIADNTIDLQVILDTVNALPEADSGGIDTSDATATAGDILGGKTAYVDGEKVTGTILTKTSSDLTTSGATVTVPAGYYASQATKSVSTVTQAIPSISVSSSGLITASTNQTAGYVSAGTKSATQQLTTQAAKTVTPNTSSQTAVASGRYTTGAVTVAGDENLKASNIKSGVSIFGVAGNVAEGENLDTVLSTQDSLISQIQAALIGKAAGGGGDCEIGTFTLQSFVYGQSSTYKQQTSAFVIGMTWREWLDSPLNVELFYSNIGFHKPYASGENVTYRNAVGSNVNVSTDSTASGQVTLDDIIQDGVSYMGYMATNPWL